VCCGQSLNTNNDDDDDDDDDDDNTRQQRKRGDLPVIDHHQIEQGHARGPKVVEVVGEVAGGFEGGSVQRGIFGVEETAEHADADETEDVVLEHKHTW
jgi:hypothetical protein